jgi:cell wall-associated NlpC family hydrolase
LDNFTKAGFYEVDTLQRGDVLICRVGRTEHPNHAAVFLADDGQLQSEQSEPCIGSALILHHPYGGKSVREIYGAQWQERVVKIVRHQDVKNH